MCSPLTSQGQRYRCWGGADLGGDGLDLLDDAQVALRVLAGEARVVVRQSLSVNSRVERIFPLSKPWPSGEEGSRPTPRWQVSGNTSAVGPRVYREYSDFSTVIGGTAWARRIVATPASDRPMWRTVPSTTNSARAPRMYSPKCAGPHR